MTAETVQPPGDERGALLDVIDATFPGTKAKLDPYLSAEDTVCHLDSQRISESTARAYASPALEQYRTSIPIDAID